MSGPYDYERLEAVASAARAYYKHINRVQTSASFEDHRTEAAKLRTRADWLEEKAQLKRELRDALLAIYPDDNYLRHT